MVLLQQLRDNTCALAAGAVNRWSLASIVLANLTQNEFATVTQKTFLT